MATARAHAKINLALSVGAPPRPGEPDAGLHPIASLVAAIDLNDDLELEPGEPAWSCRWADDAPRRAPIDWDHTADLAARALRRLAAHIGRTLDARIAITKRIPVGGGLGGGSADAAACLRAANAAFDLGLAPEELAEIAAPLGSDIPFFLDDREPPRPALVTRFGDRVERVAVPAAPLLLIIPPFGCSTPEVYRAFDNAPLPLDQARVAALLDRPAIDPAALFNDLAGPARRVQPRLAQLRAALAPIVHAPLHLSGSGSTMFVITRDAPRLARELALAVPGPAYLPATTLE
jgi:4-diphosphocytidyl-2-C-methyl-D-erythritol kinase